MNNFIPTSSEIYIRIFTITFQETHFNFIKLQRYINKNSFYISSVFKPIRICWL